MNSRLPTATFAKGPHPEGIRTSKKGGGNRRRYRRCRGTIYRALSSASVPRPFRPPLQDVVAASLARHLVFLLPPRPSFRTQQADFFLPSLLLAPSLEGFTPDASSGAKGSACAARNLSALRTCAVEIQRPARPRAPSPLPEVAHPAQPSRRSRPPQPPGRNASADSSRKPGRS